MAHFPLGEEDYASPAHWFGTAVHIAVREFGESPKYSEKQFEPEWRPLSL
jgi:hypothetical protein